jgi:hypothetical protein
MSVIKINEEYFTSTDAIKILLEKIDDLEKRIQRLESINYQNKYGKSRNVNPYDPSSGSNK